MSDVKVKAVKSFDLFDGHGLRAEGDEFSTRSGTAAELVALGLAIRLEPAEETEPRPKRRARANGDENE